MIGVGAFAARCRSSLVHCLAAVLLAAVPGAAACTSGSPPPVEAPPPAQTDARLGAGDTFEIRVYGEEDLSGKHRIAEDGTINFPLVGRLEVAGKDTGQIADLIAQALAEKQILRDPHVSVLLLERTSRQVSIVGAVAKPGTYSLSGRMSVIEAIGAAGGLTPLASGDNTIVTRRVDGELKRFKVPIESISQGRIADFTLQGGDIVFVPERLF